jgi:hypothetical protein
MPVIGPRNERFEGDIPKDLHGIALAKLYIAQAVDPKGYRHVVLLVRTGTEGNEKFLTFPTNFYSQMAALPSWFEEKVRAVLIPKVPTEEVEDLDSSAETADVKLPENDVNVMEIM